MYVEQILGVCNTDDDRGSNYAEEEGLRNTCRGEAGGKHSSCLLDENNFIYSAARGGRALDAVTTGLYELDTAYLATLAINVQHAS